MKTRVIWQNKACFLAETADHKVIMDGPAEKGGENRGPRPMEMLLMGIGGCSSFDVTQMLMKGRQAIENCEVDITAERADAVPAVFTKIHLQFKIWGKDLNPVKIERAIHLSAEKYCSASILMQKAGVEITHGFEIFPALENDALSNPTPSPRDKRPQGLQGLHHLALFVEQFEATLNFYHTIIGMDIEWQPDDDNVYLCSGKDNLALHRAKHKLGDKAGQRLDHTGFILENVESVAKWCEYLRSQGVPIKNEPKTHRDGATSFYAADPDGNLIQFIHHPPISLYP